MLRTRTRIIGGSLGLAALAASTAASAQGMTTREWDACMQQGRPSVRATICGPMPKQAQPNNRPAGSPVEVPYYDEDGKRIGSFTGERVTPNLQGNVDGTPSCADVVIAARNEGRANERGGTIFGQGIRGQTRLRSMQDALAKCTR
jgi:hypothetical protein